jgi:hypothetical protein
LSLKTVGKRAEIRSLRESNDVTAALRAGKDAGITPREIRSCHETRMVCLSSGDTRAQVEVDDVFERKIMSELPSTFIKSLLAVKSFVLLFLFTLRPASRARSAEMSV